MLLGAALVPAAPLLVDGIAPSGPEPVSALRRTADAAVRSLPAAGLTVLLASGSEATVHRVACAGLAGIGRPDLAGELPVPAASVEAVAIRLGARIDEEALPLDLAVLALRLGTPRQVLAMCVPRGGHPDRLVALGHGIADAAADLGVATVLIAAGEGSAALGPSAPRYPVDDAEAWEAAYLTALTDPELGSLARLGPEDALRMASRGWACALVCRAALDRAGHRLRVSAHTAPRGVGYVIATTSGND